MRITTYSHTVLTLKLLFFQQRVLLRKPAGKMAGDAHIACDDGSDVGKKRRRFKSGRFEQAAVAKQNRF